MTPRDIFVLIAALCLLNGMFSPGLAIVVYASPLWYPDILPGSPSLLLYLASLLLSTATLIVSGVPAALWERATGAPASTVTSMSIWLFGAVVLSVPAGRQLLAFG